jgi:VIT1/CCC1 family predicted Fe2+/Mn2+ transporter
MAELKNFTFGASSAVITSLAIIIGLSGMPNSQVSIIAALFILALADNISDSFGIHIYQRSENGKDARKATVLNFFTRLLIVLFFASFVILFPMEYTIAFSICFGLVIIIFLSYSIAKERKVNPHEAVVKYVLLTVLVMMASFLLREIINKLILKQ